jgi:hypothetical protein
VLACPFCGAEETDRIDLEGRRFLVFRCMFTPQVDPVLTDPEIADRLARAFAPQGSAYFRGTCDTLHVYVTKGAGARVLRGDDGPRAVQRAP